MCACENHNCLIQLQVPSPLSKTVAPSRSPKVIANVFENKGWFFKYQATWAVDFLLVVLLNHRFHVDCYVGFRLFSQLLTVKIQKLFKWKERGQCSINSTVRMIRECHIERTTLHLYISLPTAWHSCYVVGLNVTCINACICAFLLQYTY